MTSTTASSLTPASALSAVRKEPNTWRCDGHKYMPEPWTCPTAPGPFPQGTVRIPLSGSCLAQAHGDTRGQHEEGLAVRALGWLCWRMQVVFGSKLGRHYKTPRATAGTGHCRWAAWERQLRWEVQEMLPILPSCSLQVPGSLPIAARLHAPWQLCRALPGGKKPQGAMQSPARGWLLTTTCPCWAAVPDEPGCSEKSLWHFLKRARRLHAGAQPHHHSIHPSLHRSPLVARLGSSPSHTAGLGRQRFLAGQEATAELAEH